MQETWVQSLGQEDPLEKERATHSSTLAWNIPWTEEPGRLHSMGSQTHWATSLHYGVITRQVLGKLAWNTLSCWALNWPPEGETNHTIHWYNPFLKASFIHSFHPTGLQGFPKVFSFFFLNWCLSKKTIHHYTVIWRALWLFYYLSLFCFQNRIASFISLTQYLEKEQLTQLTCILSVQQAKHCVHTVYLKLHLGAWYLLTPGEFRLQMPCPSSWTTSPVFQGLSSPPYVPKMRIIIQLIFIISVRHGTNSFNTHKRV